MKKQGYIRMEMSSLEKVLNIISDYRNQGLRFVYEIDGHANIDGGLVHGFTTYGDLPEDMEEMCESGEELWGDDANYQRMKKWWKSQFKDVPEKTNMREIKLPKRHKPDDIITILVGPHKGEKITYHEWRERVAPIMRNISRCMGAMFEGKGPKAVLWEEVN